MRSSRECSPRSTSTSKLLLVSLALLFSICGLCQATEYEPLGRVIRFYGNAWMEDDRDNHMNWVFLGGGQDVGGLWEGRAITIVESVWPEFNGQWYLKEGVYSEHWELWDSPFFTGMQAIATLGDATSDEDFVFDMPSGYMIDGHVIYVEGVDTVKPVDVRETVGSVSKMYADRADQGSGSGNLEVLLNTFDVPDAFHGRKLELIECGWPELNGIWYLKYVANADSTSSWYELYMDPAFTLIVSAADPGLISTTYGGEYGYLIDLAGRFVEPTNPPPIVKEHTHGWGPFLIYKNLAECRIGNSPSANGDWEIGMRTTTGWYTTVDEYNNFVWNSGQSYPFALNFSVDTGTMDFTLGTAPTVSHIYAEYAARGTDLLHIMAKSKNALYTSLIKNMEITIDGAIIYFSGVEITGADNQDFLTISGINNKDFTFTGSLTLSWVSGLPNGDDLAALFALGKPAETEYWQLSGSTTLVNEGPEDNPWVLKLDSEKWKKPWWGSIAFTPPTVMTFNDIGYLGAEYNVLDGTFGGNSPRFSILIDENPNGYIDKLDRTVYVRWGTPPSYQDNPGPGWHDTGNLYDPISSDTRVNLKRVGGVKNATIAQAQALIGTKRVLRVTMIVDRKWFKINQQFLLDKVRVGSYIYDAVLETDVAFDWSVKILIDQGETVFGDPQSSKPRGVSGLAASLDGQRLYAGYSESLYPGGEVRCIDLVSLTGNVDPFIKRITGISGKAIAVDDTERIYIADGSKIVIYRGDMVEVLHTISGLSGCEGVAVVRETSPSQLVLYYTERSLGTLTKMVLTELTYDITAATIDTSFGTSGSVGLASDIRGVEVDTKERVWVAGFANNTIYRLSSDGMTIDSIASNEPLDIGFNGDMMLVTRYSSHTVGRYSADSMANLDIEAEPNWSALGLDPNGQSGLGAFSGIAVLPDLGFYVSNEKGQTLEYEESPPSGTYVRDYDPILFGKLAPGSATLTLLTLNGGEYLIAGESYPIDWTTPRFSEIEIDYSTDNGQSWQSVFPSNQGNTGSYVWQVPDVASDQCRIRISDFADTNMVDVSEGVFSIAPATTRFVNLNFDSPTPGWSIYRFNDIQEAITYSVDGYTIKVMDGTYNTNKLEFSKFMATGTRAITVKSLNGPGSCIIDCQSGESAFYFHQQEGFGSVVDGFTITNGTGMWDGTVYAGGGIFCLNSKASEGPTISNCIIEGNTTGAGGGIYCSNSSPRIINCTIRNNTANDVNYALGGGIVCYQSSSPEIIGCTINNNLSNAAGADWGFGGGIGAENLCSLKITDSIITDNFAFWSGGGVSIAFSCDVTITNSIINGNSVQTPPTSLFSGGGLSLYSNSDATIVNSNIVNNASPYGSAISCEQFDNTIDITNSIIWGNQSLVDPNEVIWISDNSTTSIIYSNVQEEGWSADPNYHNRYMDPRFMDPLANDYRLFIISPCLDSGTDVGAPGTDIEGNLRPSCPDRAYDMGAYERTYSANMTSDFAHNCQVDVFDLLVMVDQWLVQAGSLSTDIYPPGGDGVTNMDDFGSFSNSWLNGVLE